MCKLLEKVTEVKMTQLSIRMEVIYMVIIFIQMTDGIYWIMKMPTKAQPNLSLREYAIMKVVYTRVIAYIWIWHDLSEAEFET